MFVFGFGHFSPIKLLYAHWRTEAWITCTAKVLLPSKSVALACWRYCDQSYSAEDRVFGPATTTRGVYDIAAQHVVGGAMEGVNGENTVLSNSESHQETLDSLCVTKLHNVNMLEKWKSPVTLNKEAVKGQPFRTCQCTIILPVRREISFWI